MIRRESKAEGRKEWDKRKYVACGGLLSLLLRFHNRLHLISRSALTVEISRLVSSCTVTLEPASQPARYNPIWIPGYGTRPTCMPRDTPVRSCALPRLVLATQASTMQATAYNTLVVDGTHARLDGSACGPQHAKKAHTRHAGGSNRLQAMCDPTSTKYAR